MFEDKFRYIEDLTDKEVYDLMDSSDKINEDDLHLYRGMLVNVAFDSKSRIIAVGNYGPYNNVYDKSIIRGCICPHIVRGFTLSREFMREHNVLLEISLSNE